MIVIIFLYIILLPYLYMVLNDLFYLKHYKIVLNGLNNGIYSTTTTNMLDQGLFLFNCDIRMLTPTSTEYPTIMIFKNGDINIIFNYETRLSLMNNRIVLSFKFNDIIVSPIKYYYKKRIKGCIHNIIKEEFINTLIRMNSDISQRINILESQTYNRLEALELDRYTQVNRGEFDYTIDNIRRTLDTDINRQVNRTEFDYTIANMRRILDELNMRVDELINDRYQKFKFLK